MKKATLAQRDKLWGLVQQKGTPREQMQQALRSGLFSDVLDANLNLPVNRAAIRRILGLKPNKEASMKTPFKELVDLCPDVRLCTILENIGQMYEYATIGDYLWAIHYDRERIFVRKGFGKWCFVELHELLSKEFAIHICNFIPPLSPTRGYLERNIIHKLGFTWNQIHSKDDEATRPEPEFRDTLAVEF